MGKIKWNWGTKLAVWMALFMLMVIVLVVLMFRHTIHLVEPDYYPKALEYQNHIDKRNNAANMDAKVHVSLEGDVLKFTFPAVFDPTGLSGKIILYRPSETGLDIEIPVNPDTNGVQYFSVAGLVKGRYTAKIDYLYLDVPYYEEKSLLIKLF
jgi:hypothetical protein